MSTDIVVRAMEARDVPAVTEVFNQPRAVWGTLQTPFTSQGEREKRFAGRPANLQPLVAELDAQVVGCLFLSRHEHHRRSHVGEIGMAVHDAFAGRGAGSALVAAAIDLAERWWQVRRIELTVYADNARAIALYERFGFEREGLHRAYAWRDGAYADCLAMARLRP